MLQNEDQLENDLNLASKETQRGECILFVMYILMPLCMDILYQ